MAHLYPIYSNSHLPLSPLIRWRTGSEFSHVGLILEPRKEAITENSLITHSALSSKGVRFTTVKSFLANASNYKITELHQPINDLQFIQAFSLSKIYEGTPYDLQGAVGLGLGQNWQIDSDFWCSEWLAFILKNIGLDLAYLNDEHRITPKHTLEWPQTDLILPF